MSAAEKVALPPRLYEAIYILRPDITKEASERVAGRVDDVVKRHGGKLTLVENWGRRPMAYDIAHAKRGLYVYVNYLGDGALVAELERNWRMLDEVIRFQTVKLADEPGELAIDEDQTKFEAIEPPADGEDEDTTLEQELGLVQAPAPRAPEAEAEEAPAAAAADEATEAAEPAAETKADASAEAKPEAETKTEADS